MSPFRTILSALVLTGVLSLAVSPAHAGHVYAGITDTNGDSILGAGDALSFVNNSTGLPVSENIGTFQLGAVTIGNQAGLLSSTGLGGGSPSYTSLSSTGKVVSGTTFIAAKAFAPIPGSLIQLQLVEVTGPAGATFSFWDEGSETPTFSFTIGVGPTAGTGIFDLTDVNSLIGDGVNAAGPTTPNSTNGSAPQDAYGHLHGRSFTVDTEGTYTVKWMLIDQFHQHGNSSAYSVIYNAVPEPGTAAVLAGAGGLAFLLQRRRRS